MVNVDMVPEQPFASGVMLIVAVIGVPVVLVAVNAGIEDGPDPLAASPIAVLLFVQMKVVPETGPVSAVSEAKAPLQYA